MKNLIIVLAIGIFFSCRQDNNHNNHIESLDTVTFSNFNIIYDLNFKDNYFSSLDSMFSRQYLDSTKLIKVDLTTEEKRTIYRIVNEIDFETLPDTLIRGELGCILPSFPTTITIIKGKNKKTVYDSGYCNVKDSAIENRFKIVEKTIREIIYSKKEVNSLPINDMIFM